MTGMARDRPTSFITYPLDRSPGRRTRLPRRHKRRPPRFISPYLYSRPNPSFTPPETAAIPRRAELPFPTAFPALPTLSAVLVDVLALPLTPKSILLSIYPPISCPRWLPSPLVNCPIELTRTTSTGPF